MTKTDSLAKRIINSPEGTEIVMKQFQAQGQWRAVRVTDPQHGVIETSPQTIELVDELIKLNQEERNKVKTELVETLKTVCSDKFLLDLISTIRVSFFLRANEEHIIHVLDYLDDAFDLYKLDKINESELEGAWELVVTNMDDGIMSLNSLTNVTKDAYIAYGDKVIEAMSQFSWWPNIYTLPTQIRPYLVELEHVKSIPENHKRMFDSLSMPVLEQAITYMRMSKLDIDASMEFEHEF